MSATAYPLCWPVGWPRTTHRDHHPHRGFRNASFGESRHLLSGELDRLRAAGVVLSTNVTLNLSGQPYANQRTPDDPGVAIYCTLRGRHLVMARDAYPTVAQNIRSLALAIEHLRGLERHGGGTMIERAFAGFAALPDPNRVRTWRDVLGYDAESSGFTPEEIRARHRELAMKHHPDHGGTDADMAQINRARDEALLEIGLTP
jgi:hypothetical protein